MTRTALRWVLLAAVALAGPAFAQVSRGGSDEPNQETLKRLAQQLGAGNSQLPQNIDPELMKLAAEYLKKNPDLMKDPAFQKQVQQMQEQAKQNPEQFKELVKKQNPNLSQQQIDELKQQFQKSNPGGFQPPPNFPQPQPGQPPIPPDPTKPPITPGQPPFQPGQPQPGQFPPGQFPQQPPGQPPSAQPGQGGQPGQAGKAPTAADKVKGKEEYQQVVGMWENTFGDIDQTPAFKQSLIDVFSGDGKSPWDGNGNGKPWDGTGNGKGNAGKNPWDGGNGSNSGSQSGFISWLKNSTSSPPSWWKNLTAGNNSTPPPKLGNAGYSGPSAPTGGFGSGGGLSIGGLSGAGLFALILVLVVVAGVVAFLIYRYWPQIQAKLLNKPKALPGLGPWTIDPREVVDRETLVKAFEYLSVLICGDGARVWNHQTIADAFRDNVPGATPFADPLARLYALARYSPAHEPISQADIAAARGYLCRLAGVQG